jgi:hypothetical protein
MIMPFPNQQFLLSRLRKTEVLIQVQMREVTHPFKKLDIGTAVTGKKRGLLLPQTASQGSPDPENS